MIDEHLQKIIKHSGCITFNGATDAEIAQTNAFLKNQNFAEIPKAYYELLHITNGLICDGVELMGTQSHPRQEKRYIFSDLLQINKPYANYEYFAQKLILGRLSESLIVYDQTSDYFAIVDRVNLLSRMEVDGLENLLFHLCKICGIKV